MITKNTSICVCHSGADGDTEQIVIELPWPPSTNHYYRHVIIPLRGGKHRSATLISSDGRKWLRDVDGIIAEQNISPIHGPVSVYVALYPPNRRSIDVDNRLKPTLDAIKKRKGDRNQISWLMDDDDCVYDLRVRKFMPVPPDGKCIVVIEKVIIEEQGVLF